MADKARHGLRGTMALTRDMNCCSSHGMINASLVKGAMWNSSAIAWNIGRFLPVKTLKYSG